jgi:hypothetical protein
MEFIRVRILELYWTISRVLGYGHLHDGSSTNISIKPTSKSRMSLTARHEALMDRHEKLIKQNEDLIKTIESAIITIAAQKLND